jgi:hypothetical protein
VRRFISKSANASYRNIIRKTNKGVDVSTAVSANLLDKISLFPFVGCFE